VDGIGGPSGPGLPPGFSVGRMVCIEDVGNTVGWGIEDWVGEADSDTVGSREGHESGLEGGALGSKVWLEGVGWALRFDGMVLGEATH